MKRLTLSFLTFCFALVSMAEPIGKNAALYTAKSYMLAKGKTNNQAHQPFKASSDGTTTTADQPDAYYYVFNAGNDGGYVIVSGDDRIEPILGYVDHGSFDPDNIPENMRSWLQLYADQIKYVVDNNIQPDDPILRTRNKVQGTKHSVGEMLTTRWNQGKPYNITCPTYYTDKDNDPHQYPATGCTATAMAQVMYFYRYPDKTKAIIPSHSNTYTLKNNTRKTVTVPAVPKNTILDWDNMRDTYSWEDGHVGNAQDTAVVNLMLYCGQAVHMGWGPSSGANFSAEAYINYFGYDPRAYVGERRDYSIDEWFNMLYNEIEQGYPVLFSGFSSGGGHAFVLDGFDGENLFHLNWGWGGGSNGWFLVSILNPGDNSGIGASSSSDGYSMSQRALFNLRLPGAPYEDAHLSITNVSVSSTSVTATFTNQTGAARTFNVGAVTMAEDGSLALVGSKVTITGMKAGASVTKSFTIKNRLPEGTYRISPASKLSRSEEWVPKYSMNVENSQYVVAMVDSLGGINLHFNNPSNESISIDTIVFPGTRIAGKQQEIKVTFRNNGKEYFKEIRLFASKTNTKVYAESKSSVAIRSGETVDVSYYFKPDSIPGTYNLWFCTGSDGSGEIGRGTMETIAPEDAVKANLSVTSYTITNVNSSNTSIVYGKCLIGKASIKNNKNVDFNGRIKLTIWNMPPGDGYAYGGASYTYELHIPATKSQAIEFSFDGLRENDRYYLQTKYVDQDGDLGNGGIWDLGSWTMASGLLTWKSDGSVVAKAYATSITVGNVPCGVLADCKKINRMSPNKTNPNTIYAFGAGMDIPDKLEGCNVVSGNHADRIDLTNDKPYYLPATFDADSASFTYTFPETEDGTKWHAITMPFRADSIFLDDEEVALDDTLNHFWIYEFTNETRDGSPIFTPAKTLRGGTPYIIAADATMAGRSLVFRSTNVPFYKTGTDKMVVASQFYQFHGNTYSPKLKEIYVMNADGTAFEYTTTTKTLSAMESYFTTNLVDSLAPASIVLPDIPVKPVPQEMILDEMATAPLVAGTYDQIIFKRTFDAGYNTICVPFAIENVAEVFGEGAQAYEFYSFDCNELNFIKADVLAAGKPYVIIVPNAITEDIVLSGITIEEGCIQADVISVSDVNFHGTYAPVFSGSSDTDIYGVTAEGTIVKLEGANLATGAPILVKGFRAYFDLPTSDAVTLCLYDDPTGISLPSGFSVASENIYNLAGQRLSKMQKGINIVNSKKVLR